MAKWQTPGKAALRTGIPLRRFGVAEKSPSHLADKQAYDLEHVTAHWEGSRTDCQDYRTYD